jgi:23S rRNA (adenine-N6)-dimethyltransferase
VEVVCGDALVVPPPQTPYRAFGNIPFAITTALLRRLLDDPSGPLVGADLLVQLEVARKRASIAPSTLLTLGWAPWWTFALQRRIAASAFQPSPSVDAGLLVAARREPSLLHARDRAAYLDLVRRAFRRASWPVRRSLRDVVPAAAWKQLVRERGLAPDALPRDLDVFDWVALWQRAAHRVSADSTSPHQRPSSRG